MRILCDAVPFCFGPISTLNTVIRYLRIFLDRAYKSNKVEIMLLADKTSMELADPILYDKILKCNTESTEELKKYDNLFKTSDIFISNTNPISTMYATNFKNLQPIYIDILFWMWPNIPQYLKNVDFYFIENFKDVNINMKKFGFGIKNPIIVGPIIDESYIVDKIDKNKNILLISYGGMESSLTKPGINTNYPFLVTKIIMDVLMENNPFDKIVITGRKKVINSLSKMYKVKNVYFKYLPHNRFLTTLAHSSKVLISPGLTTIYETFAYGKHVMFLPSQNYSQYLQLKKLRELELAPFSFDWDDVMVTKIREYEIEEKGVKKVLDCIKMFEMNTLGQQKLKEDVLRFFSKPYNTFDIIKRQREYYESLGPNGGKKIAEILYEML